MQELEKILEEIENTFKENIENIEDENGVHHFVIDSFTATFLAKDIIRKHMNDGWIPVEERLPEDGQIVIISMYNNIKWVTIGSQCGGVWKPYNYITDLGIDVKAWRYLPDPYRSEKGE